MGFWRRERRRDRYSALYGDPPRAEGSGAPAGGPGTPGATDAFDVVVEEHPTSEHAVAPVTEPRAVRPLGGEEGPAGPADTATVGDDGWQGGPDAMSKKHERHERHDRETASEPTVPTSVGPDDEVAVSSPDPSPTLASAPSATPSTTPSSAGPPPPTSAPAPAPPLPPAVVSPPASSIASPVASPVAPVAPAGPEDARSLPGSTPEEPIDLPTPIRQPEDRVARPLPRVIAVANQKGGVGKTTTTVNLGASLALFGYRVLVVDLDPQGNATTGLGVDGRGFQHSMYDVLLDDTPMVDCIEPVGIENLFVAPATLDLAGVEQELFSALSRELRLKRALATVVDDYDFIFIDCPPSLGLITINAFAAASEILVPVQCEFYALEGLTQLQRIVTLVQRNLNEDLEISTVVLTMYDGRTKLSEDVANEVRRALPHPDAGHGHPEDGPPARRRPRSGSPSRRSIRHQRARGHTRRSRGR